MGLPATDHILLAEDDENDVFLLKRAFKQSQIPNPLTRVKDGEDAVNYLHGAGPYANRGEFPLPGIMLVDLKMPRKNGFELIAWVRQQPRLKRIPVVVLTSSKESSDIDRAYEMGANTYLVKPVKLEGLVELAKTLGTYWMRLAEKPNCR